MDGRAARRLCSWTTSGKQRMRCVRCREGSLASATSSSLGRCLRRSTKPSRWLAAPGGDRTPPLIGARRRRIPTADRPQACEEECRRRRRRMEDHRRQGIMAMACRRRRRLTGVGECHLLPRTTTTTHHRLWRRLQLPQCTACLLPAAVGPAVRWFASRTFPSASLPCPSSASSAPSPLPMMACSSSATAPAAPRARRWWCCARSATPRRRCG
mmetsp:Transcript_17265/g.55416  ORF Transcript_17265/g.55416 Transcript_17265/m.55416 type:complete len:213 (-) Transcript_17265:522-1160(-)